MRVGGRAGDGRKTGRPASRNSSAESSALATHPQERQSGMAGWHGLTTAHEHLGLGRAPSGWLRCSTSMAHWQTTARARIAHPRALR
eukprot:16441582-Heterocapsa_arctica.AAC.1